MTKSVTTEEPHIDQQQILPLVRRWGGITTDAVLDPACKFFQEPGIDGFIGYRQELNCAIVLGDPVCDPADWLTLAQAFHIFCEMQNLSVIYIIIGRDFAEQAMKSLCSVQIGFGKEFYLDPHSDPRARTGTSASLVRRKVRHAQKENCIAYEYLTKDAVLEKEIEQVAAEWLQSRRGFQIYISRALLFKNRLGKRWFYAQQGNRIVGVLLLNQLQAKGGWLLNHLMFLPQAPHGIPELLVTFAIDQLRREECSHLTFGAVPEAQLTSIVGLNKFYSWIVHGIYQSANKIFHLDGHKMFWGKFHPESTPLYLLFDKKWIGPREIVSLFRSLHTGI